MPFNLFTSNRLENLVEFLADSVKRPLSSPFERETVVVQSRGMQRWISLEIAKRQGICANFHFPFPNAFVQEIVSLALKIDTFTSEMYEPRFLTWKIMKLLPGLISRPAFGQIQNYLQEPRADLKRMQLSERVADLFDQYLLFRPKMVLDWEKGKDAHWQAELWRAIVAQNAGRHRAETQLELLNLLNSSQVKNIQLPERISVFGISALPEFHIQLFDTLSKFCEVNLYLLNPCREYWGDIKTPKEERKSTDKRGQFDMFAPQAEVFSTQGNGLLASTGKLGRDFFDLFEEKFNYDQHDDFIEPDDRSLLASIQNDVLNLRQNSSASKKQIEAKDRSVQFHSCHSKRREVEVLQDHLLDFLQKNPDLKPSDILVMAPDIEPYTPYIYAAFDLPRNDRRRLPFSMADRLFDQENQTVNGFLTLLNIGNSRFGATEVLNLLELPTIRRRYHIEEEQLELIQTWVEASGIRWGRDAADREKIGMPPITQNTWQFGLERLLLGYALPGDNKTLFNENILPLNIVEGQESVLLGNFTEFIDRLFHFADQMSQKHTLAEWRTLLENLLDTLFFVDDESFGQIQTIRRVLAEFSEYESTTGFDEEIDLAVVKHHLKNKLRQEGFGFGFLTGGVTFCSMLPMRSIPAKIICLIGMNNDAYPRNQRALGFDLMAQNPRKGDRSRRNDDRYLFLETLLSARQTLYISFIGQNIKDNSKIIPSVLVAELQDYIENNYALQSGEILDHITVGHRLQAFSPTYYNGEKDSFFSYSASNCEAAEKTQAKQITAPAEFLTSQLPEPDESFREVNLEQLYRFFKNPAEFFFRNRLGVTLPRELEIMEDKEAFDLFGLSRYKVADDFLAATSDTADLEILKVASLHSGALPLAEVGVQKVEDLATQIKLFLEKNTPYMQGEKLPVIEFDFELAGFRVTGKLDKIRESGQMISRYGTTRAKDHLLAWLQHIVLNYIAKQNYPKNSYLTGVETLGKGNWVGWQFKPLENSEMTLINLLDLYWRGLHQPKRFFPETALYFVNTSKKAKGGAPEALVKSLSEWYGKDRDDEFGKTGERDNPYFYRLYRLEENPLNDEFVELAARVYEPLLASREAL